MRVLLPMLCRLVLMLTVASSPISDANEISMNENTEKTITCDLRFDFGAEQGALGWRPVLDQVMGGRSTGELSVQSTSLHFVGFVSLENNGGFASVRSPTGLYDLSMCEHVSIRYRALGLGFALTLNQHSEYYKPRYKAGLSSNNGEWQTDTIALRDFNKVRLGERLTGQPSQHELANTIRIGLISDQKAEKEFELDVDYIEFK